MERHVKLMDVSKMHIGVTPSTVRTRNTKHTIGFRESGQLQTNKLQLNYPR
jgi:hypothetical protein